MANSENERRESFRIDMQAYVKATPILDDRTNPQDYFRELESISLVSELKTVDQEYFLTSERIKDLASKKSIDLIHQKVDILSKLAISQTLQEQSLTTQNINISEGGCFFQSHDTFKAGQKLAIAIVFQPSYFTLMAFASVVETPSHSTDIHLRFHGLSERQQQLLVKHMFQAQTDSKKQEGVL